MPCGKSLLRILIGPRCGRRGPAILEAEIKKCQGKMTIKEAANKLNVSGSKVWKTWNSS